MVVLGLIKYTGKFNSTVQDKMNSHREKQFRLKQYQCAFNYSANFIH